MPPPIILTFSQRRPNRLQQGFRKTISQVFTSANLQWLSVLLRQSPCSTYSRFMPVFVPTCQACAQSPHEQMRPTNELLVPW